MNRPHTVKVELPQPLVITRTPSFDFRGDVSHFSVYISIDDELLASFDYRIIDGEIGFIDDLDHNIPYPLLCTLIGYDQYDEVVRLESYILYSFFDTPDDSDTYE